MTSILTNTSAIAALQTLRSISSNLADTQGRVSSGLRVATASDNAAYWSISTTMRSDNMAISAVQDALGLGAAKVDTAYAGMEAVIDVLSEFQSKLVSAKESGMDRSKIQGELEQLKDQVVSISTAASFSSENWLSTKIENIYDASEATAKLTESFVRDALGVSVRFMDVDLSKISLFNSAGGGLLQADDRSPGSIGGIRNTIYNFDPVGGSAWEDYVFDGPLTFTDNSTAISFTLILDADNPVTTTGAQAGATQSYTIDRNAIDAVNATWNGVVSTRGQWRQVLESVVGNSVRILQDSSNPARYTIQTAENSARGSSYEMTGFSSTLASGKTGGLQDSVGPIYGTRAYTYSIWDQPFEIKPTVEAYIAIAENGVGKTLTLTRDTIMAALGTTNGQVNSVSDYIQVLNYAFANQGMGISASDLGSGLIRYDFIETVRPDAGRKSSLGVTGASDNIGNTQTFGLLDINITTTYSLDGYISGVQSMLSKVIGGAAILGSVQTRIDLQEEFASRLSDSIDRGVGRLVDADINEEATKLKALQTQQQLSVQALSIANESPSLLLQLFR